VFDLGKSRAVGQNFKACEDHFQPLINLPSNNPEISLKKFVSEATHCSKFRLAKPLVSIFLPEMENKRAFNPKVAQQATTQTRFSAIWFFLNFI